MANARRSLGKGAAAALARSILEPADRPVAELLEAQNAPAEAVSG